MPLINVSRRTRRGMELSWPNNFALPDRPVPHFGRHGANLRRLALRERVEIDAFDFDLAWKNYRGLFEHRLRELRIWVNTIYHEGRIDYHECVELNAYFGKAKFGERHSAKYLSKYACQALALSEHVFGTDLAWAKGWVKMFGPYAPYFEKLIDNAMKNYHLAGPGFVGEDEVSSPAVGDPKNWNERGEFEML